MASLLDVFVKIGVQDEASDKISSISSSITDKLGTAAKVGAAAVAAGVAAVGAGVVSISKSAYEAYAAYEQLEGGVSKLFGTGGMSLEQYAESVGQTVDQVADKYESLENAQDAMIEKAKGAYASAGLSANDYIDQVTSFSAALINSLDGDTEAAVEKADKAMTAMSDNVNTFGTDVESVQNAYQGFAKQNYTMLDNLKLGYAGTKEGMEQLIADANEYAAANGEAADLTIDSFADIVDAIELIQEKQGIAGTTAREAASTIEGSTNQMKAAWENFLTAIGDPEEWDVSEQAGILVDSVFTFLGNAIPEFVQIGNGIGTAIFEAIPEAAEAALSGIGDILAENFGVDVTTLPFYDSLSAFVEDLPTKLDEAFTNASEIASTAMDTLGSLFETLSPLIEPILETLSTIGESAVSFFDQFVVVLNEYLIPALGPVVEAFGNLLNALQPIWPVLSVIGQAVMTLGGFLGGVLFQALATIINIIASVIDWFMNLDTNLNTAGEAASTFVNTVVEFIGSLPGKIGGFINSILTKIGEWKTKMVNKAKEVGSQFKEAIVEKFNEVVDWFKGLPGRIISAIGDLGSTLVNAGKDLINGLFSGINSVWSTAGDVFGAITSAIPNLKGPEEVDKKLLEPNGEMIINSLFNGFDKAWEKSKGMLGDFTGAISSDFTLNASGGASAGKTVNYYIDGINVNATSDGAFAEEFVNLMMRYKRLGNA